MSFFNYFSDIPEVITFPGTCGDLDRRVSACTPTFEKMGFRTASGWKTGACYRALCRTCPRFRHEIGCYFGKGQFSDRFEEKTLFHLQVKNADELAEAVERMPRARQVFVFSGRNFEFSPMEKLTTLRFAYLDLVGKGDRLWDMSCTPNLSALELYVGSVAPDLGGLGRAFSLEHLVLSVIASQTNVTVLPDFDFFAGLENLRTLVLAGITHEARSIAPVLALPHLSRAWFSPNLFPTEDYAAFEARHFMLCEEYGIFKNTDYECPFGMGRRAFRSAKGRDAFLASYRALMEQHTP